MQNLTKTLFVLLLTLTAFLQANAQTDTNTPTFHTNVILNVNISLTAYVQRNITVSTNRVLKAVETQHFSSRDIIDAIAADVGHGTNDLSGAKLMLRYTDLGTTNENSTFILRKGGVDIEVSANFDFYTINDFYTFDVNTETINNKGIGSTSDLTLISFSLHTTKGTALLQGLTRFRGLSVIQNKQIILTDPLVNTLTANVVGSGFVEGRQAIWRGTVSAGGRKVEIIETP